MSKINEIVKRRDEAARSTSEKGWIHAQVPTWDDIDYLLSQLKDGGAEGAQVNLQCPANKGTADGQWYICTVPLKVERVIITPSHDGPHNFVPVQSRTTAPTETSARCGECVECGHNVGVDKDGICNGYVVASGSNFLPCLCKCVFPVSGEVAGEQKATPLCPVHQHLEDSDKLECEIGGNNCVACSLNERAELLKLLAPFAAKNGSEDSLTVMRRVVDFYDTHSGENRVVVSYPVPVTPVAQPEADPVEQIKTK